MQCDIGANIRRLRLARSMTQEQLAQRLNLTAQAVSKWENGVGMPDIQLLPELSVLLGTTIDGLFSMTDETRYARVEGMLEDVRFLPDDEFEQIRRWLKERRDVAGERPRATLLLAQLYNKRAEEYRELAAPLAREALRLNPEQKDAHNAVFDLGVLKRCLRDYGIEWRRYTRYVCTVQMGRRVLPQVSHKLNVLCEYYGIPLDHHRAASDSRACAQILLRYLADGADLRQHIRTYSFTK